jgi:hypothetical protein
MPRRLKAGSIDVPPAFAALQAAQAALDLANRRVMELESVCETLHEQLGESKDRADAAELALWQSRMLDEAGQVALNQRAVPRARRTSPALRQAH